MKIVQASDPPMPFLRLIVIRFTENLDVRKGKYTPPLIQKAKSPVSSGSPVTGRFH